MEELILHNAVEQLNKLDTLNCTVLHTQIRVQRHIIDAQIQIKNNQQEWKYNVEIKTKIVPAQIERIKDQMARFQPYILIADYITTQAKEILRDNHIPYLDTAGNIFLQNEGLYVYIETHTTNRQKLTIGTRAFNKAGLKVIYQFLVTPHLLNRPYRDIGDRANVAIDTVTRVMGELLREKYIIQKEKKLYKFIDKTRLFEEWVTAFNRNLRPKLKQAKYRLIDKGFNWKRLTLPANTQWGGAVAAEIVTDYLIADKGIIYTALPFQEVMQHLKIRPDDNGEITIFEKFWETYRDKKYWDLWETDKTEEVIHPMLLYADLINEMDPRYLETADKIYKEHVKDQL